MKQLAYDKEGNLSWCTVPPEDRGKNGCPHIGHAEKGESAAGFIKRAEEQIQSSAKAEKTEKEKEYREWTEEAKALWAKPSRTRQESEQIADYVLHAALWDNKEHPEEQSPMDDLDRVLNDVKGTGLEDIIKKTAKPLSETGYVRTLDLDGYRFKLYEDGTTPPPEKL